MIKNIDVAEGYKTVCLCGAPITGPIDDSQIRTITLGPDAETCAVALITTLCTAHKDAPKEDVFVTAVSYIASFHQKAMVVE